ncbi:unnamed protein product [Ceutorhynchus assimilis]|uniref:Uncharacterized protein n=1 Tax=Ceutorhynchus assimilis TaxID=467358 RepID=A0A9N9MLX8_9CUCU|nr:unnamed protein product [Ceutorhynchus assimilis]
MRIRISNTYYPMSVEESEMLDLKPERQPEPPTKTPQVPFVPQQIEKPPTEDVPAAPLAGKFGWTSNEETFRPLPFVTRDSERFIAKKICETDWFLCPNAITTSEEYFRVYKMTSSEATTYNEVNISHCDRGLVGNYFFLPGDILFNLEDIKKFLRFLAVFKHIVKYKNFGNDMFGFVKINKENYTVPFVWSEGRQLMPTFYFDGVDEILKDKCICITDKWMRLYLRVCFILQKVRPELYNLKSIRVIDAMDIKPLFAPDTNFTLSWPEDGYKYENFLTIIERNDPSPEAMLAAMHGVTGPLQSPPINQNPKQNRPDLIPAASPMNEILQSPPMNQNRPDLISRTPATSQNSNIYNFSAITQLYQRPANDNVCSNPFCKECSFNNIAVYKKRRRKSKNESVLPTVVPQQMPTSSSTNRLSNVPYASPQSASSPEMQFPSPIISGASTGTVSGDLQINTNPQTDLWSQPVRSDPRTTFSQNNEPYRRQPQDQQRSRLPALYSYQQQFLAFQQQANNINNRVAPSVNTPLPQTSYSAGYNNGTPANMQNVIGSSAGYNNNRIVSSSNQNMFVTPTSYNNVSENTHLAQSVIVNSAGYYMSVDNQVYLPGSVTSSRTTVSSNGIETLL